MDQWFYHGYTELVSRARTTTLQQFLNVPFTAINSNKTTTHQLIYSNKTAYKLNA